MLWILGICFCCKSHTCKVYFHPQNTTSSIQDVAAFKGKLESMCRLFNRWNNFVRTQYLQVDLPRPSPRFATDWKDGKFYSKVSVGTLLAASDQNSSGSASLAESQGRAAHTFLSTFPHTWMESTTPKAPDQVVSSQARPFNLVGQLNSAGKSPGSSLAKVNPEVRTFQNVCFVNLKIFSPGERSQWRHGGNK